MHELSICRSIADIAVRHAGGRPVTRVRVRVGQLRQIVPATLTYCWDLVHTGSALAGPAPAGSVPAGSVPAGSVPAGSVPAGSVLAGSVLEVESVPATIRCRACGTSGELAEPLVRCAACLSLDVVLLTGEEFLVTSLELADTALAGAPVPDPGKA